MFKRILQIICLGIIFVASNQTFSSTSAKATVPVLSYSERYVNVVKQVPEEECREVRVRGSGDTSSHTPELLGAIIGGSLANELDDSDTSKIAGALLGASIGSDLEKRNKRGSSRTEMRCETVYRNVEVREADGYNVNYEYMGHTFRYAVNSRPGSTIDVNVIVVPVKSSNQTVSATVPVLSVSEQFRTVVKEVPEEQCREVRVRGSGDTSSHTPELLGAIIGGSLANELDDSDTSKIAGALLGASIGSDLEKRNKRGSSRTELRCETVYRNVEVRELNGYNVSYEYQGNVYTSKVDSYPHSTIDVQVFVVPVDALT